jgi:hypothetical protein
VSSSIVIIGPSEALPGLKERLDSGVELHTFSDADALDALDHILLHQPRIVAVELEFSASTRGAALVQRIKDDPALADCEVRIVTHEAEMSHVGAGVGGVEPTIVLVDPPAPLDQRGTRRAERIRIAEHVEILVDGNAAQLVDLSPLGAQVVCTTVLRPNQRVRLALSDTTGVIRCSGAVAWASFEIPKGQPPRYRAGVELPHGNPDALSEFAERHRRK